MTRAGLLTSRKSLHSRTGSLPGIPARRPHRGPHFVRKNWTDSGTQRDGAVFVEFALILPIFLLFLLAIMEFASLFFVRTLMLNTARDAARAYSIRSFDAAQAEQFSLQRLSTFGLTFTASASPQSQTGSDRWVEIRTASAPATLGDPLGLFSGQELVVRVTMRQEE